MFEYIEFVDVWSFSFKRGICFFLEKGVTPNASIRMRIHDLNSSRLWCIDLYTWIGKLPCRKRENISDIKRDGNGKSIVPEVCAFGGNTALLVQKSGVANQLRLVVNPIIYQGFSTIQTVLGNGISEPSTV